MTLLIQKFGGSSVGTIDRIHHVASLIKKAKEQHPKIIVVVSAMQGDTDRLIQLTKSCATHQLSAREYDRVVSLGESISSALLAIALHQLGIEALSLNGSEVPIMTDDHHQNANIIEVQTRRLKKLLNKNIVPIVTGFQGITKDNEITTLGRGGSDITAVAIAAAMKADECHIYTDVEGVFTSDPNVVKCARLIDRISYTEMLALSRLGAKVLHRTSVLFAKKWNVPVRVLSTFKEGTGTLLCNPKYTNMPWVSGVTFEHAQAKFSIVGIPKKTPWLSQLQHQIAQLHFDIDMTVENHAASEDCIDYSFTVHADDAEKAALFANDIAKNISAKEVIVKEDIAKLSVVGLGMTSHAGLASKIFQTLAEKDIPIYLIASTEAKISTVIDRKHIETGANLLHQAFLMDPLKMAY